MLSSSAQRENGREPLGVEMIITYCNDWITSITTIYKQTIIYYILYIYKIDLLLLLSLSIISNVVVIVVKET